MNLRGIAITGVTWTAISQFSRLGIQLVTMLILARLLQPSDFGLLGMALVIIGFVNVFKDLGTSSAIIQKKEVSQQLLSSIFWFNVLFGILMSTFILLLAPLVAGIFKEERLVPIIRVFVISFFATTLLSVQQALLEKKMNFRRLALIEITAAVTGAVVGISIALSGGGVWSLVFQTVSMTSVLCLMLWSQNLRWIPSFHFALSDVNTIRSFSTNLTGFTLLNYFLRNADSLIIGRYLGATELGLYNLAFKIIIQPVQNLTSVLSRAMFPLYSTIADDHSIFRKTYIKITATIAFFTLPFYMLLMVVRNEFVLLFFGEKWFPISQLLLVLAPIGFLQSIDTTTGSLYLATGRTDVMLKWGLFTGILSVGAYYVGSSWGIQGVATGYLIATALWTFHGFKIPLCFIEQNVFEFFGRFRLIALTSTCTAAVVLLIHTLLDASLNTDAIFTIDLLLFVGMYLMFSNKMNTLQITNLLSILRGTGYESRH